VDILAFWFLSRTQLRKEGFQFARGFIGEQSGMNFATVVQSRVRANIIKRTACTGFGIVRAEIDVLDSGGNYGAGTHRAGFKRNIERATD
jgi:hypothetical protein